MPKLRVHNFAISLDGYAAGPNQSLDNPLGVGGERLHEWVFATRTVRQMQGEEGGDEGIDDEFAAAGRRRHRRHDHGAQHVRPDPRTVGRRASGRAGGATNPPYHHPVFVLTHHPRPPITMEGGTTFHFVDDGIDAALERALDAAEGKDVRLGGGASTIQQYLRAGLIDEMHLAIVPVLLGGGERLFDHLDGGPAATSASSSSAHPSVVHARLVRSAP